MTKTKYLPGAGHHRIKMLVLDTKRETYVWTDEKGSVDEVYVNQDNTVTLTLTDTGSLYHKDDMQVPTMILSKELVELIQSITFE